MNIEYLGEHLWFGKAGHLLVILAFVFSFVSAAAYFLSSKNKLETDSWKPLARLAFFIHGLCVIGIVGIIFYILYQHYFEYYYVWEHSSRALPFKYLSACFWEGQEGSFLLWAFWHVILSLFIIRSGGTWEAPVMSVIALVQVFLSSMLLGIYFFGYKIGSSPFILLREHPDMAKLPFIHMADYLEKIRDGRGLNPLLQNYWMVIHPPTLFLGFASTVVPFAFAIAGLMTRRHTEWVKPAIPWGLFGVMILGAGILMGAAWAYEALSFGGFWAWDPVENASLVPWVILVGAVHLMLIYKHKGRSLLTTYILTVCAFLLVLYSTFLTRSGILGDASVHAFTDLGMSGQLILYMAFFVILAFFLLIRSRKEIPATTDEENFSSREFWMFIGVLVLVISAFQVTLTTSIPVINKIFGSKMAPPADLKAHYNAWQLPIAVILTFLIAVGQYFKWKESDWKDVMKRLAVSFSISAILTGTVCWMLPLTKPHYIALLFCASFAVVANLNYVIVVLRGKSKLSGSSLAHAGFGMIMIGALISNAQSRVISQNHTMVDFGKDIPNNENVMLVKNDTVMMGEYFVTYKGKEKKGVNIFYEVEYYKYNWDKKALEKEFTLKPTIQVNPRMGNVSEPSTRHYFDKDIYTHITYADMSDDENDESKYKKPFTKSMAIGDTTATSRCIVILRGLEKNLNRDSLGLAPNDLAVGADLEIIDANKKTIHAMPVFVIRDNYLFTKEARADDFGLKLNFTKVNPDNGKIDIEVTERKDLQKEFVIMKAIVFPGINILWSGAVLMVIGSLLSMRKRILKNKQ